MMRRLPRLYPFLLAAWWILGVYQESGAPLHTLWRPLGIALVATAIVYGMAGLLFRSREVGALAAATAASVVLGLWIFASVLVVIAATWPLLRLRRRLAPERPLAPLRLDRLSRGFEVFTAVLLGLAMVSGAAAGSFQVPPSPGTTAASAERGSSSPDIYLILLDGYPSLDTTSSEFGIDNEPFARDLTDLGFTVSRGSRSNYMQTWPSVSSLFWMRYLSDVPVLAPPPKDRSAQVRALSEAINSSASLPILRAHGYRIVSSPSFVESTDLRSADEVLDDGDMVDLEQQILTRSVASLDGDALRAWVADEARAWVAASFAHIPHVLDEVGTGPIFFFDHVLDPHAPDLHYADGSPRDAPDCYPRTCAFWMVLAAGEGLTKAGYGDRLADELTYLNAQVLAGVKQIVARDPSAIIIVFSDHGARFDDADRPEWFRSFLAARTPGQTDLFGPAPSPVNYLPTLFDAYFGMSLPTRAYSAWWATAGPLDLQQFTPPPAPG
ncbi:MAG TPA: hypothetical protein VFW92_08670 [Candidatus Limnocylindrales bacterium]|nr:hypothetical protein [Candidatus Limnocylindrales bacterium]